MNVKDTKKNYTRTVRRNKYSCNQINKPMTLIIGVRCQDGVVLAGDRRVMRGTECSEEKKIITPLQDFIVGYSGSTSLMDKFLCSINDYIMAEESSKLWGDFALFLEDSVADLERRYGQRIDTSFDVLYCTKMNTNHANLYHIYNTGISEEMKTFDIIGHGQPHALPFLKAVYYPEITMNKAVRLCAFVLHLIDKCNVDVCVGGKPQIIKIPDSGDPMEISETEIDNLLKQMQVKDKLKAAIFK
jgi:20S proteasome alpha/beta subunit